ncbi:hypothetical protein [Brachyspira hyodysenteriae]|uniref:hypothetical protein n=1 Tax=Brachyspira hyodysenteriae TaxID=159 RepID=UPI0022CDFE60|nr:hypothetical protein [Brachyspira hyodysenteriae]MCZ9885909.1 hypothetical protein [Brachyspira hyodysenteriae]
MFEDKPPFHYRCRNCGYFFTTDKKLNVPSELSFISLDSKEAEKDENGNIIVKIDSKKRIFYIENFKKIISKMSQMQRACCCECRIYGA